MPATQRSAVSRAAGATHVATLAAAGIRGTNQLAIVRLIATWAIHKSWGAKIGLSVISVLYLFCFSRNAGVYAGVDFDTVTWVALLIAIFELVLIWTTRRDTVSLKNKIITPKTAAKWSKRKKLTNLELRGCRLQGFQELQNIPNLTSITLTGCNCTDISDLSKHTGLKSLDLSKNRIQDISSLAGLTGLEKLGLSGNQITDITPLSHLTALVDLDIGRNQIADLRPITGLHTLRRLGVAGNAYQDLSPLASLDGLQILQVHAEQRMILGPTEKIPGLKIKNVSRQ